VLCERRHLLHAAVARDVRRSQAFSNTSSCGETQNRQCTPLALSRHGDELGGRLVVEELTTEVSWLGVIAGAVVSFLIGWLWYSPKLFGVKWAEGSGLELGNASSMPVTAMISQVVGLFLMSWFVGVTAASNALLTVILATVAFTVLGYSGGMFGRRSRYARNVDAGYWIICLVAMVVCQGIF